MRKEGMVSLWVGNTYSQDSLDEFLTISYDEDGDYVPSPFASAFRTGRYKDDLREAKFYGRLLTKMNEISKGFSYYETIMPKFENVMDNKEIQPFNTVILLYDFEYDGTVEQNNDGVNEIIYIGSVEYMS